MIQTENTTLAVAQALITLRDENKALKAENKRLKAVSQKLYKLLKLACYEFEMVANWCEKNGMNDDARSYWNLIFGLQDALAEARGEK